MSQFLFTFCYLLLEFICLEMGYIVVFRASFQRRKNWLIGIFFVLFMYCLLICVKGYEFTRHMSDILGVFIPLFTLQGKRGKWLLLYPAAAVFISIIEVSIGFVFAIITGIPDAVIVDIPHYTLGIQFCTILSLLLMWLCIKCRKKQMAEIEFSKRNYVILCSGIICAWILVGCAQGLSQPLNLTSMGRNIYSLAVSVLCLVFIVICLWNSTIMHNQEKYQQQIDMLNKYMEMQEKQLRIVIQSDERLRAYRHDMKNHLLMLQSLSQNSNNHDFQQYVDEILQNSEIFHAVSPTGNTAVDAVLNYLYESADKGQIKLSYDCVLPEILPLTLFDLCTLLSNLIQNAIDACEHNRNGKEVLCKIYPYNDKIYIMVKNPAEYPVNVQNQILVTTKEDKENHGFGSKNVKCVVEKYEGELTYRCDSGCFTVEILI